jgi:hypothetical protein
MIDWPWLLIGLFVGCVIGWVLCALVTGADTGTPADGEDET